MKRGDNQHGHGVALGPKEEWVRVAQGFILDLLGDRFALVHPELEALLGERGTPYQGKTLRVDAHIITEALQSLKSLGLVEEVEHTTKGGRALPVLVLADRTGRQTATERAVRRKAMLYTRFRTLSDTAGPAGEEVVRHSMGEAGPHLIPMESRFGEVRALFGQALNGPLDSGAWLHNVGPDGVPGRPVAVPLEVKNRRLVIYPIHKEVHQLLAKAAQAQAAQPDYPVLPVLVCRRAHARVFWMARDLGFRVHAAQRQFVHATRDIDERKIDELRTELGLQDLTVVRKDRVPLIEQFFRETLLKRPDLVAQRWALVAPVIRPFADALRQDAHSPTERILITKELHDAVSQTFVDAGLQPPLTWALPTDEDEEE